MRLHPDARSDLPGSDLTGRRSARSLPKTAIRDTYTRPNASSTGERRAAIFAAAPTTLDQNKFPVSNAHPLAPDFTERVLLNQQYAARFV